MDTIAQSAALDPSTFGNTDRARFWRETRHGGLECLSAAFRVHRYAPHSHDTFVIGVIEAGCEAYRLRGERHYAMAGDVCFVNPGEVHDGEPLGDGYAYRMTYPSEALMAAVAADLRDRDAHGVPHFRSAVVTDPEAFALFGRAHRLLEAGAGALGADEALLAAYALLVERHADVPARPLAEAPAAVQRARDYLDAHHTEDVDLATLAAVAGLSRHHLVRAFKRHTGLTPHAFQTDRRVRTARRLLGAGEALADVAAACGFSDQSHLTRVFKARVGVPPGAFRVA
ncbi:helix-turn-helix transcriptional regulator [Chthonobacter rhizosphaerae]|uniref:helix-turn-helix transcriptional regulator n=1 Tax=Chthonobacter rhizosphaerae TaxID=2735553 RepID=UPI0015EF7BAB|nr:AraC family transcriptional regulator [Chthonobacter rhizosphaerae]